MCYSKQTYEQAKWEETKTHEAYERRAAVIDKLQTGARKDAEKSDKQFSDTAPAK